MSLAGGLIACGVSVVFFGSMFVPIKKYNAEDGMFAQWVMSSSILVVGFVIFCFIGFSGFYPLAMLGGMFWTIGNATAIPIISRLGMTLGILIWNTSNCLIGWATGRFGLFGTKANPPASSILNYGGLVCVIIGGLLFSRIRSGLNERPERDGGVNMNIETTAEQPLNNEGSEDIKAEVYVLRKEAQCGKQRLIGFAMALIAGSFYGMTFVPVNYMVDNPDKFPNYPKDGLTYVFSHYFGIFLTATAIFISYAITKGNQPVVPPSIFLPAFVSGSLWGIAQAAFFVANQNLSQAITFPIITMLPGCVSSAWSILYFEEIKGRRNMTILAVAMSITLLGAIMVGLSKTVSL